MRYLANAFSLQMIPDGGTINIKKMGGIEGFKKAFPKIPNIISIMGHQDLANLLSAELGADIKVNRESIVLTPYDVLYVVQVVGGRLPEGCIKLPEGTELAVMCVTLDSTLKPWHGDVAPGSIYGAMLQTGRNIADMIPNGTAKAMQDEHQNFYVEIEGNGFYGTIHDD